MNQQDRIFSLHLCVSSSTFFFLNKVKPKLLHVFAHFTLYYVTLLQLLTIFLSDPSYGTTIVERKYI